MIVPMSETTTYPALWHASAVQLIANMTPEQWLAVCVVAIFALLILCD